VVFVSQTWSLGGATLSTPATGNAELVVHDFQTGERHLPFFGANDPTPDEKHQWNSSVPFNRPFDFYFDLFTGSQCLVGSDQNATAAYIHRLSLAHLPGPSGAHDFVASIEFNGKARCSATFDYIGLAFRRHNPGSRKAEIHIPNN
jgi:hypothetical protein